MAGDAVVLILIDELGSKIGADIAAIFDLLKLGSLRSPTDQLEEMVDY